MTNEDIRRILRADPFQPFLIHLVDGRRLPVLHRDFVWFPEKSQRVAHVTDGEGHEVIINTTIVVAIERFDPDEMKKQMQRAAKHGESR